MFSPCSSSTCYRDPDVHEHVSPNDDLILDDLIPGRRGNPVDVSLLWGSFIRLSMLRWLWFGFLMLIPRVSAAGGPKYVAGSSFFDPAVMGKPVHWANGRVNYYVDRGALTANIDNARATSMVDAAAALWASVPTAGVSLVPSGSLNEDVSGANAVAGNQAFAAPSDVSPSSPLSLAIVFDYDGTVLDTVFGDYTSDPTNCQNFGVMAWIDRFNSDATIGHAVMVLNGRCATTPAQISMMQFLLERSFGKILGLGYAQVYPDAMRKAIAMGHPPGPLCSLAAEAAALPEERAFPIRTCCTRTILRR